ncbi:MAG: glycosyltransferase [Muribaculaceae bacterium]|nr:glycosyltransferase [Muribaculaceae bacterium]
MIETDALVSVIIPVYKVEPYLRQCIESVLAQTHSALEIILIDDGSPDRCGEICEEYAEGDGRIRVIHQPNGGLSAARNTGLDAVKGKYITFVDSDDFVAKNYVETLLRWIVDSGADIACGGFVDYHAGDNIGKPVKGSHPRMLSSSEFLEAMLYQHTGDNSVWGKLYKKSIFDGLRFTPGILYEDLDIIYKAILRCRMVAWGRTPLYYYRVTPGSILHNFSLKRADVLDVTDRMTEYMKKNYPQLESAARSRRLSAHFNIYCLLAANGMRNSEIEERCRRVIKRERGRFLFDPKVRLKNRLGILLTYLGGFPLLRFIGSRIYR